MSMETIRAKLFGSLLTTFIIMPMWYFLMYSVLSAGSYDRLVWFIFWAYVPISLVAGIINRLVDDE